MANLSAIRAVVTGATSGLGLAMAEALAEAGARVAVTSRNGARAQEMSACLGGSALGVELDVRYEESVKSAVDEIYPRLGGVDEDDDVRPAEDNVSATPYPGRAKALAEAKAPSM